MVSTFGLKTVHRQLPVSISCRHLVFGLMFIFVLVYILKPLHRAHPISAFLDTTDNTKDICMHAVQRENRVDGEKICAGYNLINNDLCKGLKKGFTLIMVNSRPQNFENRQYVRMTIANQSILPALVRIVFHVGSTHGKIQLNLKNEHKKYQDLLQFHTSENDPESLNSILELKWLTEKCGTSGFIINMDDTVTCDMFYMLIQILPSVYGSSKLYCEGKDSFLSFSLNDLAWYSEDVVPEVVSDPWDQCVSGATIMSSKVPRNLYIGLKKRNINEIPFRSVDASKRLSCSEDRKSRCIFKHGSKDVLISFWIEAYKRRYDYVNKAFDNMEIADGF